DAGEGVDSSARGRSHHRWSKNASSRARGPGCVRSGARRSALAGLAGCVDPPGQAGLAAGGGVLVDHALGGCLVDALLGGAGESLGVLGALLGAGEGGLGAGLELAAYRLVALGALDRLAVALDLALDVGHGSC